MIKITLDTNCVINLLDIKSTSATSVDELAEILRYGLEGDVNIAITTRVSTDVSKDKDEERKTELIKRLSIFPVIGTIGRYNVSTWGEGDVWAGDEHQKMEEELKKIIFPSLTEEDAHYTNKLNDIDHLIGHKINKRDIFVTDDQQILKKADILKSSPGVTVMSPKETLEHLNLQADKVVLVQEFQEKFLEYKKIVLDALSQRKIASDALIKFEELRKWLIRKFPKIKDGLFNFKFQLISVPTAGGNRVFDNGDILDLQNFNEKINNVLQERDPLLVPQAAAHSRNNFSYISDSDQVKVAIYFFEHMEDTILGYLGKIEDK